MYDETVDKDKIFRHFLSCINIGELCALICRTFYCQRYCMDIIYLQKKRNHHNYTEEYVYTYKFPPSVVRLIIIVVEYCEFTFK